MTCGWCEEPLEYQQPTDPCGLHDECLFRAVSGSVAHIRKLCSCYVPGSIQGDPLGMTKREAARAAVEAYKVYMAGKETVQ